MSETPHARDSQATAETQGNSERLRPPRGQLVLMVLCVALLSAIPAFVATVLGVFFDYQTTRWYAVFVSPGWLPYKLFSRHRLLSSSGELWILMGGNFLYYFGLIFGFVFWADRRYRRKRAARFMGKS